VRLVLGADGRPEDVVVDCDKSFMSTMIEWDLLGP